MRRHIALIFAFAACSGDRIDATTGAREIDGKESCSTCRVELRSVAILMPGDSGVSARPDAAGRDCMVGRTDGGHFLLSGLIGGGGIAEFDGKGTFVRMIGRAGAGPGEFGSLARVLVGPGDTIFVVDDSNVRVQVLSPSGEYLRSFPLSARFRSFAQLQSGDLVFYHPPTATTDSVFLRFSTTGEERGRFGGTTGVAMETKAGVVSPARDGGMWTASYWNYELAHRNADGSLVGTLVRKLDWFPPNAPYPDGVFKTALPPPAIVHMWEDSSGLLWTYIARPDPNWRPGGPNRVTPEWYERTFDTVIEVIDPGKAQLVASGKHDGRLSMVCNSHLMYTVIETPDGDTRAQILEPVLTGRGNE